MTSGTQPRKVDVFDDLFVGRERELQELEIALQRARAGRGSLFHVVGEPGIGKTRLTRAFGELARAQGAVVVTGRCWEEGGAPAYWPWVRIIRSLLHQQGPEGLAAVSAAGVAALAGIVPEVAVEGGGALSLIESEPERARFALFDAVVTFLRSSAAERPLVVIVEDLHAADAPSLILLRFLAREVEETSLLVLATHRSVGVDLAPPVGPLLRTLAQHGRRIGIEGLDLASVRTYLEARHAETPGAALVEAVHQATGGNPFFLEQLSRLMTTSDAHMGGAAARHRLPDTVRDAVRQRLALLSASAHEALRVGAVLGQSFPLGAAQRLSDLPLEGLLDALAEAVDAGLLVELTTTPHHYGFAHALVREALVADLPPSERLVRHRRAGEALEHLYAADLEPHLAELARHFAAAASAGDADKAIEYCSRAGYRALRLLAYEEAMQQFQQALDVVQSVPDHDPALRCDLLLGLADAQSRAGETRSADETFDRAAALARSLGSPERLARAAIGRSLHSVLGAVDRQVLALLEDAVRALGDDDTVLRAQALARLAMGTGFLAGTDELHHALAEDAVAVARRVGDSNTLARVLSAREDISWHDNHGPKRRVTAGAEISALGEASGDAEMVLQGHMWRLIGSLESGDIAGFTDALDAYEQLARQLGQPLFLFCALSRRATAALLAGRFGEAERFIAEAEAVGRRAQHPEISIVVNVQRTFLAAERGQRDTVAAMLPWFAQWANDYPANFAPPRAMAAWLAVACDRRTEAREGLERMVSAGSDALRGWAGDRLVSLALLAEVAVTTGIDAPVTEFHELLLPVADRNLVAGRAVWCAGPSARYLGLLSFTLGRYDEAEAHYEAALASSRQSGARPWLARTEFDYAQTLLARNGAGDACRATELLRDAEAIAMDLGMADLLARISPAEGEGTAQVRQSDADPVFVREGDYWTIAYGGQVARLHHMKGLGHLAQLLRQPGREFHVLDLASLERGDAPTTLYRGEHPEELLDQRARSAYKRRLSELSEELEEAQGYHDGERAARAQAEIDQLVDQLAGAVGLGGRGRVASTNAERARVSVTKALKSAIDRIRQANPELGRHLTKTVRTGTFCSYEAESPVSFRG